jgi:glycosyltransferase involved in cell wall biosynthesis
MYLADTPEPTRKHLNQKPFRPSMDVVVCTFQRPELLARCLQAVQGLEYPASTVVVVDNAPEGDRAKVLAARYGARYVIAPVRGVSRARNSGARACSSEIVAYLDDDMVPHRLWLSALVAEFADPHVMAVTGPVLPLDAVVAADAALVEQLGQRPWGPAAFKVDRASPQWFERANFGGIGDGNMAFRKEVFARWPGFEESIGRGVAISGGEEHHAFFSIIELGHCVAYTPRAMVFHAEKARTRALALRAITESAAYAAFLAQRHPRYAARIAKFYLEAVFARKRPWRVGGEAPMLAGISRLEAMAAFLEGPRIAMRAIRDAKRAKALRHDELGVAAARVT